MIVDYFVDASLPLLASTDMHCCFGCSLVAFEFLPAGNRWFLEGNGLDADLASTVLVVVIKIMSWAGAFATWRCQAGRAGLLLLHLKRILKTRRKFLDGIGR